MQIFGSDIKPTTGKMKVLSLSNSNESMSWPFLLQQKVIQSRNSMKWKELLIVIFLLSKSRSDCPFFNDLFLKVAIQWKWKGLLIVFLACFQSKNKPIPFADLFWKLQFNEMKSTFNCHFGYVFHKVVLSVPWRARDVYWTFACSFWKLNAPAVLGRFCTELACPCQLSYSYGSFVQGSVMFVLRTLLSK